MTYTQAMNDAGYLREWIAIHYGQTLVYGGMSATYWRGMRQVRLLARMTKQTVEVVMDGIREDVECFA